MTILWAMKGFSGMTFCVGGDGILISVILYGVGAFSVTIRCMGGERIVHLTIRSGSISFSSLRRQHFSSISWSLLASSMIF